MWHAMSIAKGVVTTTPFEDQGVPHFRYWPPQPGMGIADLLLAVAWNQSKFCTRHWPSLSSLKTTRTNAPGGCFAKAAVHLEIALDRAVTIRAIQFGHIAIPDDDVRHKSASHSTLGEIAKSLLVHAAAAEIVGDMARTPHPDCDC